MRIYSTYHQFHTLNVIPASNTHFTQKISFTSPQTKCIYSRRFTLQSEFIYQLILNNSSHCQYLRCKHVLSLPCNIDKKSLSNFPNLFAIFLNLSYFRPKTLVTKSRTAAPIANISIPNGSLPTILSH